MILAHSPREVMREKRVTHILKRDQLSLVIAAEHRMGTFFEQLIKTPLFYSTIMVPPLITLVRFSIHRFSGSSTQRPDPFRQTINAFGYTLGAYSESTYLSSSDRLLMFFVAVYAFLVDLIFSGMLFEEKLTQYDPPAYSFSKHAFESRNETFDLNSQQVWLSFYTGIQMRVEYPMAFSDMVLIYAKSISSEEKKCAIVIFPKEGTIR